MFAVKLDGVANARTIGTGWFAAVRNATEKAATGMARLAFKRVLYTSPQYSGSFVANWKLNVGSPDTSWDTDPLGTKGDDPFYMMGSSPAIQHALTSQTGKLSGFKLGETIHISNSTTGFTPISKGGFEASVISPLAVKIEEGKIKLRDVNVGAYRMVGRAGEELARKYTNIGGAELASLMRMGAV